MGNAKKSGALSILVAVASCVASSFFPIILAVTPGLFAYVLITGGVINAIISLIISGAIIYYMLGFSGIYVFALIIPAMIVFYIMLKKKSAYFDLAFLLSAVFAGALYIIFTLPDILNSLPTFTTISQLFEEYWQAYSSTTEFESMLSIVAPEGGLDEAKKLVELALSQVSSVMPLTICGMAGIMGLSNTVMAVKQLNFIKWDIKPMRKYLFWGVPKSFSSGIMVWIIGIIVLSFTNVKSQDGITSLIIFICAMPFVVTGLSFVRFMCSYLFKNGYAWGITLTLIIITFPYCIMPLALMGFMDHMLKYKQRFFSKSGK